MRTRILALALAALLVTTATAHAGLEDGYKPGALISTAWYGKLDQKLRAADLGFIKGMRPHHEGALTMSEAYLNDSGAENAQLKQLARAIFHNQQFEIGMLDEVKHFVSYDVPRNASEIRRVATVGLAQQQKFFRLPIPGPWDKADEGEEGYGVSVTDVQFAKAMIIHHKAALKMAQNYLHNPTAKNGYLKKMCLDILVDQQQEINFMGKIISQYKGNVASIHPSIVHGMGDMDMEGMHPMVKKEVVTTTTATSLEEHDHEEAPQPQEKDRWFNILRKLKPN